MCDMKVYSMKQYSHGDAKDEEISAIKPFAILKPGLLNARRGESEPSSNQRKFLISFLFFSPQKTRLSPSKSKKRTRCKMI